MQLGIIDNTLTRESYQEVKDFGLAFVETCQNIGVDLEAFRAKVPALLEYEKEFGIGMRSIGRWGTNKFDEDGKLIEEELQNNFMLIDCAAQLHCPVFNTGVNFVEGISYYDNIGLAISFLEKLLAYGKEKGVKIATYNCHWNSYITGPEQWKLIHGHLPELGIKYDPTHCLNDGSGDYLGDAANWGERFYHVHIKGTINIDGKHLDDPPAGLDMIDWGTFMGLLYKKKYDGTLSIEPHSGTWQGDLGAWGIRYTTEYIKKMIF